MKICLSGINGIPLGRHNVKDARLDQADKLVEAKKKVYMQVDLVGAEEAADADAILTQAEGRPDLILQDLEFVEMRLSRDPQPSEQTALVKMKAALDAEQFVNTVTLTEDELAATSSYSLLTRKPVVVASAEELADVDAFLIHVVKACKYHCFLTVGGKENRAWLIPQGTTAWEAAGSIHSDLQKGFIRAEIISFDDLIQNGGETGAKRAGKLRLETKEYIMQDCDITNFRFNK
jgi:hypothetical protein